MSEPVLLFKLNKILICMTTIIELYVTCSQFEREREREREREKIMEVCDNGSNGNRLFPYGKERLG